MDRRLRVIILFAALTVSLPLHAQSRIDCNALNSRILKHEVHYCVYLPASYDAGAARHPAQSYPVLYFLHGLGDNERTLFNSGGWTLLDDLCRQHKMGEFLIVAPEGGRTFYINSADGSVRYSDFFLQEFIPLIETKYRISKGRSNRAISGISMGGYGALHLAFRHPELFGSASAHSAALIEKPPMMNVGNSPEAGVFRIFGHVFGTPFDRAFWDRNNPLTLARTADLGRQKIYFDCGTEDDYGFNAGAQALHDVLASRHIAHEFHLYPGGHNWVYFAEHLPALLQFHFRVFESATRPRNSPH